MRSIVRRTAILAAVATVGLGLAAGTAQAAEIPAPPPAYDRIDDIADGLTCDGPLGGLLGGLVNCDPEDEPPFTSVPAEQFRA